jgi:polysaccharide deacetylase family protein (PEP-CTERM system associated)
MIHALTIDVEDNHRIVARNLLGDDGPPTDAVVRNTTRLLGHLRTRNVRATFFVLGEVAATFPELVRAIVADGHELGAHGFHHYEVHRLTPERFGQEVRDAKAVLEDVSGARIQGHRAPTFSITPQTRWALDILAELGLRYDSSIFPFRRGQRYGWEGFPLDIHEMRLDHGRSIIEAPLPVVSIWGKRLPACGGGYLRHFPYWYTDWAMRRVQRDRPAIVYLHPYELDTSPTPAWLQAKLIAAGKPARFYLAHQGRNRRTVESKLVRLLGSFRFAPLIEIIEAVLEGRRSGATT